MFLSLEYAYGTLRFFFSKSRSPLLERAVHYYRPRHHAFPVYCKGCGCWVEQNRGTRPTSPQTVPRLAAMTGTHPAPSAVPRFLSGVKSPTRSSVAASSNLRRARRTSTAPSVACSSLRLKLGEQLLCCSHALHRWHSLLCGCHSCDSDGLALTGPQSLVLRLV